MPCPKLPLKFNAPGERLGLVLAACVLLGACSGSAPNQPPPVAVTPAPSAPPPLLPKGPEFVLAYTLQEQTQVFSDPQLKVLYGNLPSNTEVPVYKQGSLAHEIHINVQGKVFRAFVRASDVHMGSQQDALLAAEQIACGQDVSRPATGEMLSGMLFDGKPLPAYATNVVPDEDFLGFGLTPLEDDAPDAPAPKPSMPATPHALVVQAPDGTDAYVKVKDSAGNEIVGFYVQASQTARQSLPDGTFHILFATGDTYSKKCRKLLGKVSITKDPELVKMDAATTRRAMEVVYKLQEKDDVSPLNAFKPSVASTEEFN